MRLNNEHMPCTALVTGAARRIGKIIAEHLARDGFAVAIHADTSIDEAQAVAAGIEARGGRAVVVRGDLSEPASPAAVMRDAYDLLGPIGVLVNNASLFEPDEIGTLHAGLWERHFAINLRAPVFLAQEFAACLAAPQKGVIINMIDQRVLKLNPQFMSYTLSKAALHTATITLAQSLAPRIRVVGIGPGPTLANSRQSERDFSAQQQKLPLEKGSLPEDIAQAVLFMVKASSITGQMLAVDGGQHISWRTPDIMNSVE
jgi:NAD(P)-dependent dehydrogenase (short-subunit alcohol dehydrogenase family)